MYNFKVGQLVCLKSDSSKKGAITSISDGDVYSVFINGEIKTFYPSQLLDLSEESKSIIKFSDYVDFHTYMTANAVLAPDNSSLFSLNSGKISFIPYQYRPVLKFIKSDEPRILIADSVGVGKTIEAELILKELEARKDVESVAIICPKPLISERKWEEELKRFGEDFIPLSGKELRFCIEETDMNGDWPTRFKRCIIPYSLFDDELLTGTKKNTNTRHKGLLSLEPPPRFDLVIVDEAHHIKNPTTSRNRVVNYFVQNATAVIFLTATPLELGSGDLFVLLNSLRPDLFIDRATFNKMLEPNKFINSAATVIRQKKDNWKNEAFSLLEEAENTQWGLSAFKDNPEYIELKEKLSKLDFSEENRVRLITEIEHLNTFSTVINRTRRRDIGNFTLRKPITVRCEFTDEQFSFYSHLLETEKQIMQLIHGDNVAFMMNMIERQCSSCIFGMVPFLDQIMNRNINSILEAFCEADEMTLNTIVDKLKDRFLYLKNEAKFLPPKDIKFEMLLTTIKEKQEMEKNKIIIFSTFRHTLAYLLKKLEKECYRVAVIHGDVSDDERRALRKRFILDKSDKDAIDIMLFSEVGCEGLDYQFCDYMVNYDLPWNPMKVEQRIGRIDRNGQKSEVVVIVNMITEGTIDQLIYDRCLTRIGVFENSIGDCEGILGEISEEIEHIASSFELTKAEQEEKFQQLADNKIRLIQENERLENEQYNLLGIRINQKDLEKEINEAVNEWTSPEELEMLVKFYFDSIGYNQFEIQTDKTLHHLRMSKSLKEILLSDYKKLNVKNMGINLEWEQWLKKGEQYITISFNSDEKSTNEKCMLVNIQHPLVKQSARIIDILKGKYISLTANKSDFITFDTDSNYFIVYKWDFLGITPNSKLVIIADSEEVEHFIKTNLSKIKNFSNSINPNKTLWSHLNSIHQKRWEQEKEKYIQKTKKVIDYKKRSLEISFTAERLSIETVLKETSDDRIRLMKQRQLEHCIDNYNNKVKELDDKLSTVDIQFKILVYGILNVGA